MQLAGKVALVTGAGSGIGRGAALTLAREGAKVAVLERLAERAHAVADEINQAGGGALAVVADVAQADQMAHAVGQAAEHFGRLDIVVASAAIQLHRADVNLHELPAAVWDRTHDVNYRGVFLTCKHALAQMVKQGDGGVIVIVSSVTALNGRSNNPAYLTGKHGLVGLARHIAVHYGQHGIRCNAVCPGALERTPNHDDHPNPAGREQTLTQRTPLGRLGRPDDIAPWITFLATPEAGFATGAFFVVDGGLSVA